MRFYHNLFVSEDMVSSAEQIVEAIKMNNKTPNVYVIALASNTDNLLDLIPVRELQLPSYPKETVEVIGLAKNKADAFELVEDIVGEIYGQTGGLDVKAYFQKRWEEQT